MNDYSEMTDEELNEVIALKRGWTVVIPDVLWTRGTYAKNDIEDTRELPDYTHDWRLCGDLLEEMRNKCFVSLMNGRLDNPAWVCSIFLNPAGISTIAPTPQRAICEAWLAWKED